MRTIQVFDPPMCCSTGVCGPNVDPTLPRFAADLDWLRSQGVSVERFNLAQQPGEFARNELVKKALAEQGNACLPLILVDGQVASLGKYPRRTELAGLAGVNETAACGPGCACGTASAGRRTKAVVSLAVILAIAGILAYKAASAREDSSNNLAPKDAAVFAFAQPSPGVVAAGAASQPSALAIPLGPVAGQKIGESLESLSALNKVAANQDVVIVFLPALMSELADDRTSTAVLAAQQRLKSANVMLGLYTLPTSSPDYAAISAQVQAPAILVACKGKGMTAVAGDVTEARLLQAYVATSQAGGCGPSGCGPSSPACK